MLTDWRNYYLQAATHFTLPQHLCYMVAHLHLLQCTTKIEDTLVLWPPELSVVYCSLDQDKKSMNFLGCDAIGY